MTDKKMNFYNQNKLMTVKRGNGNVSNLLFNKFTGGTSSNDSTIIPSINNNTNIESSLNELITLLKSQNSNKNTSLSNTLLSNTLLSSLSSLKNSVQNEPNIQKNK